MTDGWSTSKPPAKTGSSHPFKDSNRGVRLQRVMADAGVASRRACEDLIVEGVVTVNGQRVASLPAWVDPIKDRVAVRGKPIGPTDAPAYVMFFKPRGVVCTNSDPEGRPLAVDQVKHHSKARLFPVGRLDIDSSGLLLLTNDGELSNRITHPRHGVKKTYEVTVTGQIDDAALEKLRKGIFLVDERGPRPKGKRTAGIDVDVVKRDRDRTRLLLHLHEGRNRQVRRMLAALGFPVRKLRRVSLGPLALKGLRAGQWRDLLPEEVKMLRRAVGLDAPAPRRPTR